MTYEPHDITTVSIRAFPPNPPEVRTLQDYQDDLKRRFGRVPSWTELARRENNAMRRAGGAQPKPQVAMPAPTGSRHDNMRATWQAKVSEARQEIIRILEKPMTTGDVARVLGIKNQHTAHTRLLGMAERGLIIVRKVKGMAVWERRQEAAE